MRVYSYNPCPRPIHYGMKRFLRAFATVTALATVTRMLSFVFKIYLSRVLGAEILGLYQITFSVLMLFIGLSASGLPVTLSRITAEQNTAGGGKDAGAVTTCLILSVMLSSVTITVFIAFPDILHRLFADPRCADLFVIMLPMLLTTSVYAVIRGWFWGKKDFNVFSVSELLEEIFKILIAVCLLSGVLFEVGNLRAYAYAMLITDIVAAVGLCVCYFVKGGKLSRPALASNIIRSAAPLTVTRVFGAVMSTFLSLMVPHMLIRSGMDTSVATAEFGRAGGMVMPLLLTPTSVIGSLGVVLIPEIASFHAAGNHAALEKKAQTSLLFAAVSCGTFFALFGAMGQSIATQLYHDSAAGQYLQQWAWMMLPLGMNGLVVSLLNSLGKETFTFASHLLASVVLVVIAIWLPGRLGIHAYFLALTVFHTLSLCINLIMLTRIVRLRRKYLAQAGAVLAGCVVLCYAVRPAFAFLQRLFGDWGGICICSAVIFIVLACMLSLTGILRWQTVWSYLPKPRRRGEIRRSE